MRTPIKMAREEEEKAESYRKMDKSEVGQRTLTDDSVASCSNLGRVSLVKVIFPRALRETETETETDRFFPILIGFGL
jgi:hypothetical protein